MKGLNLNELALFAGVGGGLLGSRLLDHTPICAVEIDPYCQRVLLARQDDGALPPFPVWDDVKTFDGHPWRGIADLVSGGFPCQAHSHAAHGCTVAEDLWLDMRRIVWEVAPRFVFAENVTARAIATAARDLCEDGYGVRVGRVDGGAAGAPHKRARHWLVADADGDSKSRRAQYEKTRIVPTMAACQWWDRARYLGMDDGLADRLDRVKAIGNGQIPIVAAIAWNALRG